MVGLGPRVGISDVKSRTENPELSPAFRTSHWDIGTIQTATLKSLARRPVVGAWPRRASSDAVAAASSRRSPKRTRRAARAGGSSSCCSRAGPALLRRPRRGRCPAWRARRSCPPVCRAEPEPHSPEGEGGPAAQRWPAIHRRVQEWRSFVCDGSPVPVRPELLHGRQRSDGPPVKPLASRGQRQTHLKAPTSPL